MVRIEDVVNLNIDEVTIRTISQKAIDNFNIANNDNLRNRSLAVKLDCLFRGYLGEYLVTNWLLEHGIHIAAGNIEIDEYEPDIDLSFESASGMQYNIEIKTSLLPDKWQCLGNVLNYGDIKLIKRSRFINDLAGDVHIQIYYTPLRQERDKWLSTNAHLHDTVTDEQLIQELDLINNYSTVYLVAWIDKPSLITANLYPQTWHYGMRDFWRCPFNGIAKTMDSLPDYLLSLE